MAITVAFGLQIESAFDIPGIQWVDTEPNGQVRVDLNVVRGTVALPQNQNTPIVTEGVYQYNGNTLLFEAATVARYLCDPVAALLTVELFPGSDPEAAAPLLIATALPALLWMRGDIMLHAGAMVLPGCTRAIAFAAPSGTGKTYLLDRLLAEGGDLLAEDTLCLRPTPDDVIATGLPACLFKRVDGMPSSHRRHVPVPQSKQRGAASLGALVLLTPGAETTPRRLHGPDALAALVSSFHRPRVPRILGRLPTLMPQLANLIHRLPIYRWSPPDQGAVLPALQPLTAHLH